MCGIMGIAGRTNNIPAVIDGLRALEYRGYDSVGLAWIEENSIAVKRVVGRVDKMAAEMDPSIQACTALGHTRWATHGGVTEHNAHPHCDPSGRIAVVHNGIIDNYDELKNELLAEGAVFSSDTDTEVIAHLLARAYKGDLVATVESVIPRLVGVYALGILAADQPHLLVGVRKGSPLTIGLGDGVNMLASDVVPFLSHTRQACYLDDGQIAVLTSEGCEVRENGKPVTPKITTIEWSAEATSKDGYDHYMLKEIYEQPKALKNLIESRLSLPEKGLPEISVPVKIFPTQPWIMSGVSYCSPMELPTTRQWSAGC